MSIRDFSEQQYFYDLRSDTQEIKLGSFTQGRTTKLGNIRLFLYLEGAFADETITLHVKDDPDSPTTDFVASTNIGDVEGTGTYWLGWVRFDYDKEFIVGGTEYHLTAETSNYTEAAGKYMGVAFDYPNFQQEVDKGAGYTKYCCKFQLYGLE